MPPVFRAPRVWFQAAGIPKTIPEYVLGNHSARGDHSNVPSGNWAICNNNHNDPAICTRRAGKLYKARSRAGADRINLQKLKVPESSSGPRQEKRDNPQTRLAGLGAGLGL